MDGWQIKMGQKRADFLARTKERLEEMESDLAVLAFRPGELDLVDRLARHFHQLAGSGGVYGLDELCEFAAFGEAITFALTKKKNAVTPDVLEKLHHALSALQRAVSEAESQAARQEAAEANKQAQAANKLASAPIAVEDATKSGASLAGKNTDPKAAASSQAAAPVGQNAAIALSGTSDASSQPVLPEAPVVERRKSSFGQTPGALRTETFIVSANLKHVDSLQRFLRNNDVASRAFQTGASAQTSLTKVLPEALIVDIPLPDGNGYDLIATLRSLPGGSKPPVVLLSKEQGFLDKVQAIRCGVDAFFEVPLDFKAIVEKVKYLIDRDKPERFRILSVEDDPDQSEFIRATLEFAGYNVLTLNDPRAFEETLLAFCPDLLLLDVMMGEISGFELAKYVRQNERFVALPILFLTTENQLENHIESARSGGDDYLIKPVAPQLLVATIAGRLERYRVFQKMLKCEGLTQCLTHAAFIERATALAEPNQRRFSLVLLTLDIDGLRTMNDNYGFPAGDKVIVSMANLLRKTFRHSETIGRTGGDEFAVLIENLAIPEVGELASQLLQEFSNLEHIGGGRSFRATASAGAALFGDGMDLRTLMSEAEQALRAAKDQGGNRVVRAAVKSQQSAKK